VTDGHAPAKQAHTEYSVSTPLTDSSSNSPTLKVSPTGSVSPATPSTPRGIPQTPIVIQTQEPDSRVATLVHSSSAAQDKMINYLTEELDRQRQDNMLLRNQLLNVTQYLATIRVQQPQVVDFNNWMPSAQMRYNQNPTTNMNMIHPNMNANVNINQHYQQASQNVGYSMGPTNGGYPSPLPNTPANYYGYYNAPATPVHLSQPIKKEPNYLPEFTLQPVSRPAPKSIDLTNQDGQQTSPAQNYINPASIVTQPINYIPTTDNNPTFDFLESAGDLEHVGEGGQDMLFSMFQRSVSLTDSNSG